MKNETRSQTHFAFGRTIIVGPVDVRPALSVLLEGEIAQPFDVPIHRDVPERISRSYFNLGAVLLAPIWLCVHGMWTRAACMALAAACYIAATVLMPSMQSAVFIA